MGKKKKRETLKRLLKSKQKAKKKREQHLSGLGVRRPREEIKHYRPGISELGAPPGFRSISMAQAMMEYAKPLVELAETEDRDINEALQLSVLLWNYAISLEDGKSDAQIEKEISKALSKTLKMDEEEAKDLIKKMVDRKNYLFPPDMQSSDHFLPFMFIRKEVSYLIKPFNYSKLKVSEEKIPPDRKDADLVNKIKQLDQLVESDCDWAEMEDLLFRVEDEAKERFEKWLGLKGVIEDSSRYSNCLDVFFDFVYGYMHEDVVLLKSVGRRYFMEFFEDYLLRKIMVEPYVYADWPPALKLFYKFLNEKGYLENPEPMISLIGQIEPNFINILRKQFS